MDYEATAPDTEAVAMLRSLVYPTVAANKKQALGYRVIQGYLHRLVSES